MKREIEMMVMKRERKGREKSNERGEETELR